MADVSLALDLVMSVEEKTVHRVRKYGFGDGYELLAPDGINSRIMEYNITTRPLTNAEALGNNGLRSKLDKVCAGDFFVATLQPYSLVESRYRIVDSNYSSSYLPGSDKFIYSFSLRQAFSGSIDP